MDLELRPWQADDRGAVVEAARDPYVAEIERIGDPDEWIAHKRENGVGELGYFVLERFRGRGDV